jgi:hypothetical protein
MGYLLHMELHQLTALHQLMELRQLTELHQLTALHQLTELLQLMELRQPTVQLSLVLAMEVCTQLCF